MVDVNMSGYTRISYNDKLQVVFIESQSRGLKTSLEKCLCH